MNEDHRRTTVVVGAGLAGLTAATGLAARGYAVTVLEARDRVGGRTHGIEAAPGVLVDAGAAYLGDRHTELLALAADLGLKTTPTTMLGASRFALTRHDGSAEPATRDGRFPPLDAVALGDLFERLAELTDTVRPEAPWLTPDAERLDALTVAEWAERHLTHPDARLFLPLFLGEMCAADPADLSVLHLAFYLRSGGGLRYLNAFAGGAQQDRIDGGAHQLCQRLAEPLGARVRLGEAVRAVHQDDRAVTVHTDRGAYRADIAVLALPPLLADTIAYQPPLPAPRAGERTTRGCAIKVHLVYPSPLWREHGLSGWSVNARGPLLSTVDDSPGSGSPGSGSSGDDSPGGYSSGACSSGACSPADGIGVLTGFVTGAEAHRFGALTPERQRAEAVEQAARLFPMLPEPLGVHVTDWVNDPFSRGCYAALLGPGDWIRTGPTLTAPHQRVHWAGTETSTAFFGLMEGAIRSGHRVVAEVLARG
ncbi:flavin monoamine oxidase family protein [Streptomyces sp. CBMA123]|uniref:flavin monoamine oxidase family protein n=1 Tax=Streptomyces sp. CBMA123 TaxID=1896313 RepID=UPI001661A4CB|nr:FAD-dependent oxidoreductase [Streptomyces sp. CBMA123]MBD0689187.1 amine oxidase [Streptomyces sp. CBMA123]